MLKWLKSLWANEPPPEAAVPYNYGIRHIRRYSQRLAFWILENDPELVQALSECRTKIDVMHCMNERTEMHGIIGVCDTIKSSMHRWHEALIAQEVHK